MTDEILKLITDQGKAWEEFKAANDARLAEIEKKGAADPLTTDRLDRVNAELTRIEKAYKSQIEDIEKKMNRSTLAGTGARVDDVNLRSFNVSLASHAQKNNRQPVALNAEQYSEYRSAFGSFMRKDQRALSDAEYKALAVGSDPDGGYLCPDEMDSMIDRVVVSQGSLRQLATVRPIGVGSYKKLATTSGASAGGWGSETTAPTETGTPQLREIEFIPGLLWAEPRATVQLLEDSAQNVESWLADEVGLTFGEQESQAFISGSGVNRPQGILSYTTVTNSSYAWGSVGYTPSGGASGFAASNPSDALLDLIHALKRQYRGNANWIMNDLTLATIRKFKDSTGLYIWQPGLQSGQVGVLLGYAVNTDDFMPDIAANAFPIAFADFRRAYVVVDRRGTVVLRDNLTAKPYVKFWTTRRVGGGIQNFEAIKLMRMATS
jgi:HK97 family phage major capsid protein